MYYKVSFQYSESVYCANIAKAECAEDVSAHYSKYAWHSVSEATSCEVESARERGMPIINCPHIEPQEAPQEGETITEDTTTATTTEATQEATQSATETDRPKQRRTIRRKTYRNFCIIMNRITAKGWTKDEAEKMTHRIFDEYEAAPQGLTVEQRAAAILSREEWENENNTETTTNTTKEDENMTTETTTAETVSFPRLRAELVTDAQRRKDEAAERISKGYLERWNPANRPASTDDGIRYYSTATRWEQYQRGEITREKAVELATKRAYKQIEQDTAGQLAKLDTVAAARLPSTLSVCVTWARSRTWGTNPTATVYGDTKRTEGHASGCGYDKESAAIADAMNQQPEALRVLYDMAEKALADGQRPDSKTACTGYCWHSLLGYGSGYSVLPYFEGGCGSNTIWAILQNGGYTVRHTHSAKALDCWTVDKAESGKGVA